jgi:sterol desaturase/sphingolipid hydroxylase (fatty acid hydroxylase superfamily)
VNLPTDLVVLPVRALLAGRDEIDLRFVAASTVLFAVLVGDGRVVHGLQRMWRALDLRRVMRTRSAWIDVMTFVLQLSVFGVFVTAVSDVVPGVAGVGRAVGDAVSFWTDEPILSSAVAGALLALVSFVLADLAFYAHHRLMHRVPFLWAFHKVHHSGTELYPLTAYRGHPVQVMIGATAAVLTSSFAAGLFLELGGSGVTSLRFLGASAFFGLAFLFGAIYRHSRVWVMFPGALRKVVHSPAHHQIHHSADPADFNANYSGFLLIWDRMFGTYREPAGRPAPTRFGIDDARAERAHANPIGVLVYPLYDAVRSLAPSRASASRRRTPQHS